MLYDSNDTTSRKGKTMEAIKRSVVVGWGWGERSRQSTENFQGSENTLYDIIMIDSCHHTFVQTHIMYKSEL